MSAELINSIGQTLYMVFFSTIFAIIIGLPIGILLFITEKDNIAENALVNVTLNTVTNIFRSIPFVILFVAILPFTRLVAGSAVGTRAAIVPLTIAAAPFFARVSESSFREIDRGLIESSLAMGTSNFQIVSRVLIPETLPSLVQSVTTTIINLVGYSAMVGAFGGGGLGDLAIRYGYYRFQTDIMVVCVIVIVVLVQVIQLIGNIISRKIDHR